MIMEIRKGLHSPLVKGVLLIVILGVSGVFAFVLKLFISDGGRSAVTVNGNSVSYRAFVIKAQEEDQRLREMRARYGELMDALLKMRGVSSDPRQIALNQLIREELIDQLAKKLNIHLDQEFVSEMLNQPSFLMRELSEYIAPYMFEEYGINMHKLREHLARRGLSLKDFENKLEQTLKRSLVVNLILGASFVPQAMARSRYIQNDAARKFSVLHFDFGAYLEQAKKEPVTKQQLKSYYDAQNSLNKRYWVPEKRSGILWEFDADHYGVSVDEDQINAYYNNNKMRRYVQEPVKLKIRRILFPFTGATEEALATEKAQKVRGELIASPSLFEQKAKELSADKESAQNGGLLPVFSRGTYDPSFEKPAFLLKNDGDISGVIRTDNGIEILQRVQRIPAVVKPLSAVKDEIKKLLKVRAFKNQFIKQVKRFLNGDMENESEQKKLFEKVGTKKETGLIERSESKLARSLFRTKEGGFSFYLDGDKAYLIQTKKIQKRYLPTIDTVESVVKTDFQEEQAAKALDKALEATRVKAKSKPLSELKGLLGVNLETTDMIKRDDTEKLKKLTQNGLPVDAMFALEKVGSVGSSRPNLDGFVFVLDAIEPFNEKDFAEKKEEVSKELQMQLAGVTSEAFISHLQNMATIKVDKSINNIKA